MSHERNGNGRVGESPERLVVVRVDEAVEPRLTARTSISYQSPPQSHEPAMALVALLLGCTGDPAGHQERWMAPIAGGRRVVTLSQEPAP
jgi:hypothetical protein